MIEKPILELINISKAFEETYALDQIGFSLKPGEVHALVGENGAGKSTLIRIIAGVHQPDSGQLLLSLLNLTDRMRLKKKIMVAMELATERITV